MTKDLDENWKCLSLIEAEDKILKFKPDQGGKVKAQVSLSLIGKLYTSNSFNFEALKQTIQNIWKPSQGLLIIDLDHNLFAFQSFSARDRDYTLEEGPWAFNEHVLLLKELDINEQPSNIEFTIARFWVNLRPLMSMRNLKAALTEVNIDEVPIEVGGELAKGKRTMHSIVSMG
ncbi:hypothetical protein Cgig2_010903 [Carnegiea gigantea]|uniref:DUF4283 domain-containing protein n=1 Tax=Carnegiea gigantea TaxID=171969 RepID=A0A9Q1JIF6_9CARY|nr:hypothetical protein Cgig2_010903 [Carnegiea gigantea]